MADEGLEGAVRLVQEGKTKEAHEQLEKIVNSDVHNVTAWFWYAKTSPSARERTRILETCLRFNPDDLNTRAILGLGPDPHSTPASNPLPMAPNSLIFKAPGSPAPETDSAQSTQPIKAFKPAQPSGSPAPAPQKRRRSTWLLAGSALLLLAFCAAAGWIAYNSIPPDPAKYRHTGPVEYYLYVPKAYSADREWPLFVGIHGSGGSGLDCWNWWQSYADREGFILLCPSIADANGGWYQDDGETKVFSVINQVRTEYRIASREFLAGFSAGAQFVQGVAFRYPQYVSGVAVLSAGNYYPPSYAANVPMLVVIGDRDDPGAVSTSADFASTLEQSGFDVQYVVLPGVGHTLTNQARQLTIELFRKAQGE